MYQHWRLLHRSARRRYRPVQETIVCLGQSHVRNLPTPPGVSSRITTNSTLSSAAFSNAFEIWCEVAGPIAPSIVSTRTSLAASCEEPRIKDPVPSNRRTRVCNRQDLINAHPVYGSFFTFNMHDIILYHSELIRHVSLCCGKHLWLRNGVIYRRRCFLACSPASSTS